MPVFSGNIDDDWKDPSSYSFKTKQKLKQR